MIFTDKSNYEGCFSALNKQREKGSKRFWHIESCHKLLFEKLKTFGNLDKDIKLVRTYLYTGRYHSKLLSSFNRACKCEIDKMNELIQKEELLLQEINNSSLESGIKDKINSHVSNNKGIFEKIKSEQIYHIEKQRRHAEGQKKMFEYLETLPFLELKTTELKQAKGIIYQKGVDVQIATDLVHFAHTNAYDIALIIGGDTDLIEAIRLVRKGLGKIVIIMAYYDEEPTKSCISPSLIKEADYFYHIGNLSEKEILSISDLLRQKEE